MADWTFHPRYVSPFYLAFMGGNLARETPLARQALLAQFRACVADLGAPQLREMLRSSWRASTVAAWFIAAGRHRSLLADVEDFLRRRPGHVAPTCLCLAHLGGATAQAALAAYVERPHPCDESLAPEWALAAWSHLSGEPPEGRRSAFVDAEIASLADVAWYRERPHLLASQRAGWQRRFDEARTALPVMLAFVEAVHPA